MKKKTILRYLKRLKKRIVKEIKHSWNYFISNSLILIF